MTAIASSAVPRRREARTRTRKGKGKGKDTRARILDCAHRVIVEEGFDALSMRDLAKRCAMQLGILQYYFATRDALAVEVIVREAALDILSIQAVVGANSVPEQVLSDVVVTLIAPVASAFAALPAQHHSSSRLRSIQAVFS